MTSRARPSTRGFSLIEATLSVLLVGGLLAAALTTTGATAIRRRLEADRARAHLLAHDMMAEILAQNYADGDAGFGSFGLGLDEVGDGSRALWEDVDDYEGWEATPPQTKQGDTLKGLAGWTRAVNVAWIDPQDPTETRTFETGVKRVTVTVHRGNMELASLVAVRAWAFEEFQPD